MEHVYAWFELDFWFWLYRLPLTLFWPLFLFVFKDNTYREDNCNPLITTSLVPIGSWISLFVCLYLVVCPNEGRPYDPEKKYNRYQYVDWLWDRKTEVIYFLPLLALFSLFWI